MTVVRGNPRARGRCLEVHCGKFIQIVHVGNNHWCVVSTVGYESGVIRVYDSLYKNLKDDLVHLIASMVYRPLSELKIVMMDVEKQSNICFWKICISMLDTMFVLEAIALYMLYIR